MHWPYEAVGDLPQSVYEVLVTMLQKQEIPPEGLDD